MICRVCKGSGKQSVSATEYRAGGTSKTLPVVEIDCIWCNGTGEMTPEQSAELDRFDDAWCRCKDSSGSHYYQNGHDHGWLCNDCGKVTQTG